MSTRTLVQQTCDRCGFETAPAEEKRDRDGRLSTPGWGSTGLFTNGHNEIHGEICRACCESFRNWWKNPLDKPSP